MLVSDLIELIYHLEDTMAKKMKFAVRPKNTPGPDETREQFVERMGATGNVDALDKMNAAMRVASISYETWRAETQGR